MCVVTLLWSQSGPDSNVGSLIENVDGRRTVLWQAPELLETSEGIIMMQTQVCPQIRRVRGSSTRHSVAHISTGFLQVAAPDQLAFMLNLVVCQVHSRSVGAGWSSTSSGLSCRQTSVSILTLMRLIGRTYVLRQTDLEHPPSWSHDGTCHRGCQRPLLALARAEWKRLLPSVACGSPS